MISKVWFGHIWFMSGRQVGNQNRVIDKTWLKQVFPPYYTGRGVSISISGRSIRIGICSSSYLGDDYDIINEIEAAGSRIVTERTTEEMSTWESSHQTSEPSDSPQTVSPELPAKSSTEQPPGCST